MDNVYSKLKGKNLIFANESQTDLFFDGVLNFIEPLGEIKINDTFFLEG